MRLEVQYGEMDINESDRGSDTDRLVAPRPGAKRALLAVFSALALDYALLTVVIPILPPLLARRGVGQFRTGVLFASKALAQMVANPFWCPRAPGMVEWCPLTRRQGCGH